MQVENPVNYISFKNILRIAFPVMIGSLANNIINLVDTALLGRVGQIELGASAIGGIFYFVMIMVAYGFNNGMQIIIARRVGENKKNDVGKIFDHQLRMLVVLMIVCFLILNLFGSQILQLLIQSSDIHKAASTFIYYRSYGIFFGILNACFLAFFIGIGQTFIVNFTTIALAIINTFLAFGFIFGDFGLPQMGIGGVGLASSISEAIVTIIYIIFIYRSGYAKEYSLFKFIRTDTILIKNMIVLSYPLVFQQLLSITTWFGFFIIIEHLGEKSLAVSNIIKGIYIFWGIPTWALGSTSNSMVSNLIGQGNSNFVKKIITKICLFNLSIMIVLCSILYLFSENIIGIYSNNMSLYEDSIAIIPTLIFTLLIFSCSFIVLLSVSGTGSSRYAFFMELFSVTCYIVYTYYTASILKSGLSVIWYAEFIYWGLALILGVLFFRYANWEKKI